MANNQVHQSLLGEDDDQLLGKKTNDLYTRDGSVDFHGRPVLRSKTGNWEASYFIISNECAERLAYYGISLNLVTYLSSKLHEGNATAAKYISTWMGTTYLSSIIGAFIADSFWGRYWTIVVFSILYFIGMCTLTLSASVPALQPPECVGLSCPSATPVQYLMFFASLYLVALGAGGIRPCISSFGANQFDETDPKERVEKGSFFNWFYFSINVGSLLSSTFMVWIQENIGWGVGFSIPTMFMGISIAVFLYGTPLYRFQRPRGSPLIRICQVIVASLRKWKLDLPQDSSDLYNGASSLDSSIVGSRKLEHTNGLKCLDKASIVSLAEIESGNFSEPWKLCTVTQVEESKILVRMIPIWLSTISYGIALAQVSTTFVEQGKVMNRTIGSFTIAAASLTLLQIITGMCLVLLYDKIFVPIARRFTGKERGLSELQRMGIGLLFSTLAMVSAALVETRRLRLAKELDLVGMNVAIPLSIFWQIPQYFFMGLADVFTFVGKMEFFYNQSPYAMQSLCSAFVYVITAMGNYASSLILIIVTKVTTIGGGGGWIPNNLNQGHLDNYFWLLACLCFLDMLVYSFCVFNYKPKKLYQDQQQ